MSKQELIAAIRSYNRTASEDFLVNFNEPALTNYLHHLEYRFADRRRQREWIREAETPAIVSASF